MENSRISLDGTDVKVALASGALTAALDVLFVKDISLADAHKWGKETTDKFVMKIAQKKGYSGKTLDGAIKHLEEKYPMTGDLVTNEFGGGSQHHLRDFSHHPTPIGLIFSIIMELTGRGFGTDTSGKFVSYDIPNWRYKGFLNAMYMGTIAWFFHLISDVAGSSGTVRMGKEGTGIPGPMLSLVKELSSLPGVRRIAGKKKSTVSGDESYSFSAICSKLFNGTLLGDHDENGKIVKGTELKFDLRTELGIVNESIKSKQYLPVLLNEIIVSSFFSIRRFIYQIEECRVESLEQLKLIDINKCLPWKNDTIRHMRMISNATFSVIDITSSGIKAAIKNKNNKGGFALDFLQGINYWGIGSFAIAGQSEIVLAIQKMHSGFLSYVEKQKQTFIESCPDGEKKYELAKFALETGSSIVHIGTPIGVVAAAVGVFDEIRKASNDLKVSKEERARIEVDCEIRINVIQENREEMEKTVSDYLYQKMSTAIKAFENMDRAVELNDIELYIAGNSMIQKEFSKKAMFDNLEEFDHMMEVEDEIKF
ncbi:MAG: hypothetical protein K6G63_10420 [Eubacterium sp.]|nr:hypothetical protein [Eubacterium sp.]